MGLATWFFVAAGGNMVAVIVNWIRVLIPPRAGSDTPELRRRDRVIGGVLLLATTQGGFVGCGLMLMGLPSLAIITTAFGLVVGLLLLSFRLGGDAVRVSHLLLLAVLTTTALTRLTVAVSGAVLMPWFTLVPVMAVLLLGWRGGLLWLPVTCLTFIGLWQGGAWLSLHQPLVGDWWYDIDGASQLREGIPGLAAYLGLIICQTGMIWAHEATRRLAAHEQEVIDRAGQDRHQRLGQAHDLARMLLDHVELGVLLVRRDGSVEPQYSRVAAELLGQITAGEPIWSAFEDSNPRYANWLESCWISAEDDWMPLAEGLVQLPSQITLGDRTLTVSNRIIDPDDPNSPVLCVVSDVTEIVVARHAEVRARELAALLARSLHDPHLVASFITESRRLVDGVSSGQWPPADQRRAIHTLKGNSAVMGLGQCAHWLHELEGRMSAAGGVCVAADRLALIQRWADVSGAIEPVIGNGQADKLQVPRADLTALRKLVEADEPAETLLMAIARLSWEPAEARLYHLSDQACQLGEKHGKSVDCHVQCSDDLRVPPTPAWSSLWSTLVHSVRNAIDHGLESPAERVALGKDPQGRLDLSARRTGPDLIIEIKDDGRGVDWAAIAARASSLGLPCSSHDELVAAMFGDGLSTRTEVTELSGRGVGLNAVWHAVCRLSGQIELESVPGQGLSMRITVPTPSEGISTPLWRLPSLPAQGVSA